MLGEHRPGDAGQHPLNPGHADRRGHHVGFARRRHGGAAGRQGGRAEACWREVSCGTVSFHDVEGKRLKTLFLDRMPASGKVTLKAQLASEVAHILERTRHVRNRMRLR